MDQPVDSIIECDKSIVLILKSCMLRYPGVKYHDICNFLSNKNISITYIERYNKYSKV